MKGGINREGSTDNVGYERYGNQRPQSRGLSLPLSTSVAPAYEVANERGIFHIGESTQRQKNQERVTLFVGDTAACWMSRTATMSEREGWVW